MKKETIKTIRRLTETIEAQHKEIVHLRIQLWNKSQAHKAGV